MWLSSIAPAGKCDQQKPDAFFTPCLLYTSSNKDPLQIVVIKGFGSGIGLSLIHIWASARLFRSGKTLKKRTYPYRVWVSEIMLQQTRVEAVKEGYVRFLSVLPDQMCIRDRYICMLGEKPPHSG